MKAQLATRSSYPNWYVSSSCASRLHTTNKQGLDSQMTQKLKRKHLQSPNITFIAMAVHPSMANVIRKRYQTGLSVSPSPSPRATVQLLRDPRFHRLPFTGAKSPFIEYSHDRFEEGCPIIQLVKHRQVDP